MDDSGRTVLVTGATGNQGGVTARRLLADGWRVRALVRDPNSPAARALAASGAEPVPGDLDDPASIARAVEGAYGVFGVTPDSEDPAEEVRRGLTLAIAAAEADVGHLVFTSVGGADRDTGVPYWESKRRIEQHIREIGLPATILRPVRFMENHTVPGLPLGGILDGVLIHLFPPDAPVQLIALADIGVFAALAFGRPEEYVGEALELAGDSLTSAEIAVMIGRAVGREVTYRRLPAESLGLPEKAAEAFADERGLWRADIPALRLRHPGLTDFRTWLERGGAARIERLLDGSSPARAAG
ncbi:NmrA/HSCARG family protein [Streptosporangium carneum]|uniref:NmrA-like domain-containing protein n=1 Tax=Streptosporangium carneum TaxID=47481 RepID=A0A9W6MGW4_9ACTN|nr:NmrA/HSCARG family protein [Streptosporangium carneum]GLK13378.1 hypothetical protein GCM10017600_67890 [Streptosporangium carneum]